MIDAVESGRTERKEDEDREARAERDAQTAAVVGRMRELYATGDRSSAEMLSLRSLAQRGGMSSSEIDHAVVDHGDDDAPAVETSSAPAAAPWMRPVAPPPETAPPAPAGKIVLAPKGTLGTTNDTFLQSLRVAPGVDARLAELNKLPAIATDPGQHARSAQSYVDAVAAGHVSYAKSITPEDVKQFAVSGTLPDVIDPSGALVTSGADRVAELTTQARHGNWPAANTLVMLVDARRSALAAERGDLTEKLKSAAPSEGAPIEDELAANHAADGSLVTLRHHTQADVSQANERFAASEVRSANAAERDAATARKRGDEHGASKLDAKAAESRAHAAKVAYDESRFRAGSSGLGLRRDVLLETAAEAQIDAGRGQVDAMHRSGVLTDAPPAALGKAADAGHGVPGAEHLLADATAAGAKGQAPLALETKRQGALAAFHKEHLDRGGFGTTQGASPAPLLAHRRDYLAARGGQLKALSARDNLYLMSDTKLRPDEELEASRVREDKRDVLGELGAAARRDGTTQQALADTRAALAAAKREQASLEKERVGANAQADAKDDRPLEAIGEDRFGSSRRTHNDVKNSFTVSRNTENKATELQRNADFAAKDVARLSANVASLEQQAPSVTADAEQARAALAQSVPMVGATTTSAADAARREADLAAASQRASLDRVDTAHAPESTRIELSRARAGLAGYYATASADPAATSASENAHVQIARTDALRATVPLGDARDELAVDAIRARGSIAQSEAAKSPDASRRDLDAAERSLPEIRGTEATAEARAQLGSAATSSLVRAEAAVRQRNDFGRGGAAEDAMYGQAHRMLDRRVNGADPTVVAARKQLGQVDDGIAAVTQLLGASRAQLGHGIDVARAQVGVTGHDEASLGRAAVSGIIDLPSRLGALPWHLSNPSNAGLRAAVDTATDEAVAWRSRRIGVDGANVDEQLATLADTWSDAVRDGHAFETLGSVRAEMGNGGRASTLVGDAPLLGALRQPITALPSVVDRYATYSTATFTSGARDAMLDAEQSRERSASTATPLIYANFGVEATLAALTTGGAALPGELGVVGSLLVGAAAVSVGSVTKSVFGADSIVTEIVDTGLNFVPAGDGTKAHASFVGAVGHAAIEAGEILAFGVGGEVAARALDVESEGGRMGVSLAVGALATLAPGALRAARTTATRILANAEAGEARSARVHAELEGFAKRTQDRVPTRTETEALKATLDKDLGVTGVPGAEAESIRANVDAEVEALALSRAPARALAEMGVRPADLTPEQAQEAVGRTADLLERARGLSHDAARTEAMRALRPVLLAAGVVPAVLLATEGDAEASSPKPTPGRVFTLAKGVQKTAGAAVRDLVTLGRSRGEPAEKIAKSLRLTPEGASRLAAFLRAPEMRSLPEIASALERQQALTPAQSATLGKLQTELQQVPRLPLPSEAGERAKYAAEQRTPSGKHWAEADLSFGEFRADYRARVGDRGALSDADLQTAYAAGKRLDPDTGNLRMMRGKPVYATDTDVLLVSDLPADRQAKVNAAFQARDMAERDLRAAEKRPDHFSKAEVDALRGKFTDASRRFGETSADAYVAARFPGKRTLLWPTDDVSRSGDFDRIYRVQGADGRPKYLLVEAKGGPNARLEDRDVSGGRADQGTGRYMDTIVEAMRRNPESEALANDIDLAASKGDVEYLEVKAPADEPLAVHGREFDIAIDTGVRTK